METDEPAALLPATYELVIEDRVVNYCLYGPEDGTPVVSHNGSPSTRWKRPEIVSAIERSGVRRLADALGWERFAVHGHSGGGPYALACAALLPERVTRCAVGAGPAPSHAEGVDPGQPMITGLGARRHSGEPGARRTSRWAPSHLLIVAAGVRLAKTRLSIQWPSYSAGPVLFERRHCHG
jgi:pimeloyl-ACP methyl ester carboxylesterase